ncbi:S8 family peptidase [Methyloglobulus sp.]|uniref:S8 family peptidase n=1 Tax=Methyloglobulus sp. TaxID=2518622 RepID=UPI0032B70405
MAENSKERLPHLLIENSAMAESYSRPKRGMGATESKTPPRNRQTHAQQLIDQIQEIQSQQSDIIEQQKAFGLDVSNGIYLAFESEPDFELKFDSLEFQPSGIELCNVKLDDNKTIATVFVPEGKLTHFLKKISQYQLENTPKDQPKNKDLVESITAIKLAAIDALWTDDPELLPNANESIWWEVWLRRSNKIDYEGFLRDHASHLDLRVGTESIHFLDRIIVLVFGTREQISHSIHLLGAIAELRKAKDTADFFTGMSRLDQQAWIEHTLENLTPPPDAAPSVCILDTGVNNAHPLLQSVADTNDMHTYHSDWGTDDRNGHGTNMAGLSVYGDLTEALANPLPIHLTHRLESVKITPNPGYHTDKKLYGAITRESIARVEITADRQRVFCMAVSTTDDRDRGRPSSWSAALDAITSGYEDEQQRLVILSAGNTDSQYRHLYPNNNLTDEVHDPGQSWNALTVGGYTEKAWLDTVTNPGWSPLAPPGGLAPASCTSMAWQKTWPIKPDIVMEAGNMATNPAYVEADYIDDALQLLTTGHQFVLGKQLVSFGDTSAAAALAANLAAKVQALYPGSWPETIRALLIHSAQWTPALKAAFEPLTTQDKYRQLLRYCGYGVPDEETLFWSARNELTLIAQDLIHPYIKEGSNVKTRDVNLHTLPWPTEVLRDLPSETQVEMKVTLSYFIEPNPGSRGWVNKYRYASHGLRFDVRRPLESLAEFKQRINQKARDEEHAYNGAKPDSGEWALGEKLRSQGSVHSDTWIGQAAELAERGYIAVYPVVGWWKERANMERWGKSARYSLIVSIKTPSVSTDIYTTVENKISLLVQV